MKTYEICEVLLIVEQEGCCENLWSYVKKWQKKKTMGQSGGFFNWRLQDTLHLKKCFSLGVWALLLYFQIPNPETKHDHTFTILAIIKLFSVNADAFFFQN